MVIPAMQIKCGDVIADGSVIASVVRSDGHVHAALEDGRKLIVPDRYLLGVTRDKPSKPCPSVTGQSLGTFA